MELLSILALKSIGKEGASSYEALVNKPKINGVELNGNKSFSDLGLGSVFKIKGSVATASSLPSTGNDIGDVWYVVDESAGYIWLEDDQQIKRWEELGPTIDLTTYQTKAIDDEESYFTSNTVEGALNELGAAVNNVETWTFTLEDDTTVTKKVVVQ